MKQGKNPTVAQKAWLTEQGLNYKDWLVVKWTNDSATIVHRVTREVKTYTL